MALKYGGKTFRSLEEQVLDNMGNISDIAEQIDNFEQFTIEQINITGTTGTLTADQLTTLQASEQNQIVCDGEIFRLMDNMTNSGYLVYGHVGAISSKQTVKTITITLSTRSWILQASTIESGGGGGGTKLYKHIITFSANVPTNGQSTIDIINTSPNIITSDELMRYISKGTYNGYFDGQPGFCFLQINNGYVWYMATSASYLQKGEIVEFGKIDGATKDKEEIIEL